MGILSRAIMDRMTLQPQPELPYYSGPINDDHGNQIAFIEPRATLSEDPSMNADLAEDLVSVREQYAQLTEEDIVTFLEGRLGGGHLYSQRRQVLYAVNRFSRADSPLLSEDVRSRYQYDDDNRSDETHIWSLGRDLVTGLFESEEAQSVIMVGESGSGMMFNTQKLLEFILANDGVGHFLLMRQCGLLNLLGCTRHMINLTFGREDRSLSGASLDVLTTSTERLEWVKSNRNPNVEAYVANMFQDFQKYHDDEFDLPSIAKIVSGILHLGNISFDGDEEEFSGISGDALSSSSLQQAAECLEVDPDALVLAMTHRTVMCGKKNVQVSVYSARQAEQYRDVLATAVHDVLIRSVAGSLSGDRLAEPVWSDACLRVVLLPQERPHGFSDILPVPHTRTVKQEWAEEPVEVHDKIVNGLSQLHSNICNEVFFRHHARTEACAQAQIDMRMHGCMQESQIDSGHNEAAVHFLTSPSGPLISAIEAPRRMRKTGKLADEQYLKELVKQSKKIDSRIEGVYQDFSRLRGRKAFNGPRGGPYGCREINGKISLQEIKLIEQDFVEKGAPQCPAYGICHYSNNESDSVEVAYDARGIMDDDSCGSLTDEMAACLSASLMICALKRACPELWESASEYPSVTRKLVDNLGGVMHQLDRGNSTFVQCLRANDEKKEMQFNAADVAAQLKFSPCGL